MVVAAALRSPQVQGGWRWGETEAGQRLEDYPLDYRLPVLQISPSVPGLGPLYLWTALTQHIKLPGEYWGWEGG